MHTMKERNTFDEIFDSTQQHGMLSTHEIGDTVQQGWLHMDEYIGLVDPLTESREGVYAQMQRISGGEDELRDDSGRSMIRQKISSMHISTQWVISRS